MVIVQKRSQRKPSGARYKDTLTKRLHQKGGRPAHTTIASARLKTQRVKGGQEKNALLSTDVVSVFDQKTGKHVKAKIQTVADNPANRHFVRRNIITKGCMVATDQGNVKITSRPGQEGGLNGIKVE